MQKRGEGGKPLISVMYLPLRLSALILLKEEGEERRTERGGGKMAPTNVFKS